MPLYTVELTSVVYDSAALTLTATPGPFADNQYAPYGKLEYRRNGGAWTEVDGYSSWANGQIVGTVDVALAAGTYDFRATSGDDIPSSVLAGGVVIMASYKSKTSLGLGLGGGVGI